MKKICSIVLAAVIVVMMLALPVFAVEPDPSVESAIVAAQAAAASASAEANTSYAPSGEASAASVESSDASGALGEASETESTVSASASGEVSVEVPDGSSDEAETDLASDASDEASGEASGEASAEGGLSVGTGELINVLSSAIVLPLCFLSIILWFFRAYGQAVEKKNNVWLKIYKVLRKIHIPVGAATVIIGTYHAVFASIKHGWSLNWGMAAMIFFLLGFVTWLFRKQLKRRWIVLHRFTTLIATICMMIHAAPYLEVVFKYIVPMMLRQLF